MSNLAWRLLSDMCEFAAKHGKHFRADTVPGCALMELRALGLASILPTPRGVFLIPAATAAGVLASLN